LGFFMAKYTEQFKLTVVEDYLKGFAGFRTVANRHGLANRSLLERWVAAFQLHGADGLKPKRSRYRAEFKLSVLRHMWENRLSMTQTAARFDIRRHATVGVWERAYREGGFDALLPPRKEQPKKMPAPTTKPEVPPDDAKRSHKDLLKELNYLRAENAYLKKLEALVQARQAKERK
jgi:transposase